MNAIARIYKKVFFVSPLSHALLNGRTLNAKKIFFLAQSMYSVAGILRELNILSEILLPGNLLLPFNWLLLNFHKTFFRAHLRQLNFFLTVAAAA